MTSRGNTQLVRLGPTGEGIDVWSALGRLAVTALLLAPGCAAQVDGTAKPAAGATDPDGVGRQIVQVLPTNSEIVELLGPDFRDDEKFPPTVGGMDVMADGVRSESQYSPLDCLGVTSPLMRVVYENAPVRAYAETSNFAAPAGAVALQSPPDARKLFAEFVTQWQRCNGITATSFTPAGSSTDQLFEITEVTSTADMVTAMFRSGSATDGGVWSYTARALGVKQNVIVDVEVRGDVWHTGEPVPANNAEKVAQLMLEKVAAIT